MKERTSMKQEIIKVLLVERGESDVLIFSIDKIPREKEYIVDLSSPSESQAQLKRLFSKLLTILMTKDIHLELEIDEKFTRSLQKEVSQAYIDDLNRELEETKQTIKEELSIIG